jgi:hypothetical protein
MKKRTRLSLFMYLIILCISINTNAQKVELNLNAIGLGLAKTDYLSTHFSNQPSTGGENFKSTQRYYRFMPGVSFINNHNTALNISLSFEENGYQWESIFLPTRYTKSKSSRLMAGMEMGLAKRIEYKRFLFMPELFLAYQTMIYQDYIGYNVNEIADATTEKYLMTYTSDLPNHQLFTLGFQQGIYYKLGKRFLLGMNIRLMANGLWIKGESISIQEDKYDNLYGDLVSSSKVNRLYLNQQSEFGLNLRYRIK